MDADQRFATLAGICWHEFNYIDGGYKEGEWACGKCGRTTSDPANYPNPDFSDPIAVIRVMEEYDNKRHACPDNRFVTSISPCGGYECVSIHDLLTPGAMRDEAIRFMEVKG